VQQQLDTAMYLIDLIKYLLLMKGTRSERYLFEKEGENRYVHSDAASCIRYGGKDNPRKKLIEKC
jgi:hypothetical protein